MIFNPNFRLRKILILKYLSRTLQPTSKMTALRLRLIIAWRNTYGWKEGDEVDWVAEEIKKFSVSLKSDYWLAVYHNVRGNVYFRKGLLNECLRHFNEALIYYMRSGQMDQVAVMRNNLSVVYVDLGDFPSALKQSSEALKYFQSTGSEIHLSQTYTNLGNVYSDMRDSSKALESYMKALEIDTKQKDTFGISTAYTNIGTVYADVENYTMARVFFENALKLDSIIGDENSLLISYHNLGFNYLKMKRFEQALPFLERSLYKAKKLSSYRYILQNSKAMAEVYNQLGKSEKGIEFLLSSLNLYDSLYSEDRIRELNEIQRSFDVKQKENENRILKADQDKANALIERQKLSSYFFITGLFLAFITILILWKNRNRIKHLNRQLQQANRAQNLNSRRILQQNDKLEQVVRENKELVSILIHDLKNPLSQIQLHSGLILEDQSTKKDNKAQIELIMKASSNALNLIDRISIANRLEEGHLNPMFKKESIQELIHGVVNIFSGRSKQKDIPIVVDPFEDREFATDSRFLQNILQNLISNALKFSPKGKEINLACEVKKSGLEIRIRDKGPGFTEADKEKLFKRFQRLSATPTSGEASSGVGLSITKSLTDRFGGSLSLSLNSDYKEGAEFVLFLPKIS